MSLKPLTWRDTPKQHGSMLIRIKTEMGATIEFGNYKAANYDRLCELLQTQIDRIRALQKAEADEPEPAVGADLGVTGDPR